MENDIVCCVLCGAPIVQLSETQTQTQTWPLWITEFRALFAIKDSYEANLSGIGFSESGLFLIADKPGSEDVRGVFLNRSSNFGERWYSIPNIAEEGDQTRWGFAFHHGCWDIFNLANQISTPSIQTTFDVLRSFPVDLLGDTTSSAVNFGHNYGLWAYSNGPELSYIGEDLHPFVYYAHDTHEPWWQMPWRDPKSIPEIQDFISKDSGSTTVNSILESKICSTVRQQTLATDRLCSLPLEILLSVLQLLPSHDVLSAKLASRSFAEVNLPNSFWKTRFSPGYEFDFIFDTTYNQKRADPMNWKLLYTLVKSLLKRPEVINRRRVWKLATVLRSLTDRAEALARRGESLCSIFEPMAATDERQWLAMKTAKPWAIRGMAGYQAMFNRLTAVPNTILKGYVTTVDVYGKQYISGVRLQGKGSQSYELGYVSACSEIAISLSDFSLRGLTIASDFSGVRGISFTSSSDDSEWIGDHVLIPKQRLIIESESDVKFLKAGLDALRIYNLAISSGEARLEDPTADHQKSRNTFVWYPDIPPPWFSFLGLKTNGDQACRPVVWKIIDELGVNESPSSIQLHAVVDDERGRILQFYIKAAMTSQTHRLGVNRQIDDGDSTHSFLNVNCAQGENISGLEVMYGDRVLVGFKLFTNHGQVAKFPEEDVAYMEEIGDWKPEKHFPEQARIVGFCARVHAFYGLESFGVITKPLPEEL